MKTINDLHFDHTNTIVNFANSIVNHFGAKPNHNTIPQIDEVLKGHKKVVVMLFDGLGKNIMELHLKEDSCMRSHVYHLMEATFPPTTVASTNGMLSGLYPVENGWMSWAQWDDNYKCSVEPFTNCNTHTREQLLPASYNIHHRKALYASIFEQIKLASPSTAVFDLKPNFINNGGPASLKEGRKRINEILKNNDDCFVYFYWPSPDHELHEYGLHSKKVHKIVKDINKFVSKVTNDNKDTIFLSIADHGLIDVTYTDLCDHDDLYSLLERPVSFEKRSTTYFVKKGQKRKFKELFEKYYGEDFVLLSKAEVRKIKLFGEGEEHPLFDMCVGDYVSISMGPLSIYASKDYPRPVFLQKGHHAGFTPGEMEINVAVYNK